MKVLFLVVLVYVMIGASLLNSKETNWNELNENSLGEM